MKIQLNHPGHQKPFRLGNGYRQIANNIIREWSNDNVHFRKFIQNNGHYIDGLNDLNPKQAELYFWGEWEGNSIFNPFPRANNTILPNGLHKLFHSTVIKGIQNTDPYIYGDNFKYCVCKQTGRLTSLIMDDLILFGTVVPSINKFYIDTIFVIKDHDSSSYVQTTGGANYSQVYKEETLEQLNEYLKVPVNANNKRLYRAKTWWDDKEFFSFVPCKVSYDNIGFERLFLDLNHEIFQLSKNPTGKSFLERCRLSPKDLWKEIVKISEEQEFKLGVKFDEPIFNNILTDNNEQNGSH
jgi:hypothetical protein